MCPWLSGVDGIVLKFVCTVWQRVHAARDRINALNPRVDIVASTSMQDLLDDNFLRGFDLIVLTDSDKHTIASLLNI